MGGLTVGPECVWGGMGTLVVGPGVLQAQKGAYLSPSMKQGPSWALLAQSLVEVEVVVPFHLHPGLEEGAGPGAGAALGLGGKTKSAMCTGNPLHLPQETAVQEEGTRVAHFMKSSSSPCPAWSSHNAASAE